MQCLQCANSAVIDQPARCKEHFISSFEEKVRRTIEEQGLIPAGSRIAVAVSGGKDSLTVLTLLRRWHEDVTAIAIDEGIAGYREHTLADARRICDEHNIPLIIKSFKELCGKTLDETLQDRSLHPCTVCGTLRRHLLSVASKVFDLLATGHNADDESQAVLMNIIKGNTEVFPRLGPVSGQGALGFTRRIKPLYFCTEKEVMTYAYLKGFVRGLDECPYAGRSYRGMLRDEINRYAQAHPGVRERILHRFLALKRAAAGRDVAPLPLCATCGEPSSNRTCGACTTLLRLR